MRLGLAMSWLSLNAVPVNAEPTVSVARSGATYEVSVRMDVTAQPNVVWTVLTDYENLQRFVPGMQSARILSARGEPLLLEQKGESGISFFKVTTTTVSRIVETPKSEIRFDLVSGNLKQMRGAWTLQPHDHATTVKYRAQVVPEFALPPLIGPAVMEQNIRTMVEGVAREIERRDRSNTKD